MNERDEPNLSPEDSISDEISERVRSVLAAAESAATAIRHEAEQQAQIRKRAAEAERQRYIEDAKAEAEALLAERMKRIAELSDSIIEGAEAVLMRIEGAHEVKRQLESMVHALAGAAQQLANESDALRDPVKPRSLNIDDESAEPVVRAVPEPESDSAVVTELRREEPESEPEVTEAESPAAAEAAKSDDGPAQPRDLKPVDVAPDDDGDIEVVDAVEVVEVEGEEPSPAAAPDNGTAARSPKKSFEGDDMLAARLVALQMAVAGSARVEVEEHLRVTFDMEDPGAILNDVFGQESKL
jgi:uncharacterized protein Yka (UPF0111/DUF47 family)